MQLEDQSSYFVDGVCARAYNLPVVFWGHLHMCVGLVTSSCWVKMQCGTFQLDWVHNSAVVHNQRALVACDVTSYCSASASHIDLPHSTWGTGSIEAGTRALIMLIMPEHIPTALRVSR